MLAADVEVVAKPTITNGSMIHLVAIHAMVVVSGQGSRVLELWEVAIPAAETVTRALAAEYQSQRISIPVVGVLLVAQEAEAT